MKIKILAIALIPLCFSIAGQNTNTVREGYSDHNDLEGSVWINPVFPEFPSCIDTLFFNHNSRGFYYSCEHKWQDSTAYSTNGDTIIVNIFSDDYHRYRISTPEIVTKYIMILRNNRLEMLDIKHKWGTEFRSVDKKYITQKYRRIRE